MSLISKAFAPDGIFGMDNCVSVLTKLDVLEQPSNPAPLESYNAC
jgi:hypothetical protein